MSRSLVTRPTDLHLLLRLHERSIAQRSEETESSSKGRVIDGTNLVHGTFPRAGSVTNLVLIDIIRSTHDMESNFTSVVRFAPQGQWPKIADHQPFAQLHAKFWGISMLHEEQEWTETASSPFLP